MSLFRLDSPLMRGLSQLADLMLLNILAVICSIPIVTIGASASALYAALLFATLYYLSVNMTGGTILLAITCLAWLLWSFLFSWAFPLQSKFENTIRNTLNNSLLLSLGYFPRSLLMAVINAVPMALALLLPWYFLAGGIVWLGIWFSLAASINWRLLKKPLERLIDSSEAQEQDEQA